MKIKQIENILTEKGIEPKIEVSEAKIEARMLVKHFLGVNDIDIVLKDEVGIGREDLLAKIVEAANLRATTRKPIQHIIGYAHFMGEDFIVNENVLVPRDETEILVRKAIKIIKQNNFKKVLDIGTGSGCIACMIVKRLNEGVNDDIKVIGTDISNDALQVALDNSSKLGLFNKAIFRKSDIFSNMKQGEKFDLIISNPPYIPLSEKEKLQIEVGFEPELALFAQDKYGIEFYDKIIKGAPKYLGKGGYLMFELGIDQSDKVKSLMDAVGFKEIKIEKDLAGIDRVIWGKIDND